MSMSSDYFGSSAGASSAINSSAVSRWLTEEVFRLIDMVQRDEAIYNPRHKYYFCRPYVENFWREVDLKLEKNPGASLAKWTNLRISFRREYTNYLEEKVPPCWSYFDRMFFLHPYLRKKHQQSKSLDSQVQDALVMVSSLSNRLQRQRAVVAAANAAVSLSATNTAGAHAQSHAHHAHGHALPEDANYLEEYFEDTEPNNSELDEIIAEEQRARFQHLDAHSLNNDIKSECEDNVEDYVPDVVDVSSSAPHQHAELEEVEEEEEPEDEVDDAAMRTFVLDTLTAPPGVGGVGCHDSKRLQAYQLRAQHLHRLQTRSYHEDLRAKRPRSQEGGSAVTTTTAQSAGSSVSASAQRLLLCSSTPAHTNISFVRPTFAKPPAEAVNVHAAQDADLANAVVSAVASLPGSSAAVASSAAAAAQQRHLLHHRLEIAAVASGSTAVAPATAAAAATITTGAAASAAAVAPAHLELCDCKTDPDAMFLMSLLPDIQKLNGRDRGKIKIAFQNILQDYLYPD